LFVCAFRCGVYVCVRVRVRGACVRVRACACVRVRARACVRSFVCNLIVFVCYNSVPGLCVHGLDNNSW